MPAASFMYSAAISFLNRLVFVPAKVNLSFGLLSIAALTNDVCCNGDRSVPLSSPPGVKYGCLLFHESKFDATLSKVLSEIVTAQNKETPWAVHEKPPESSMKIFIGRISA